MAKKNAVSASGARLLRRVERHILAEPKRYNQNEVVHFGEPGESYRPGQRMPACGTVACIGGWIHLLTSKSRKLKLARSRKNLVVTLNFDKIKQLLGVPSTLHVGRLCQYTHCQANILNGNVWPERFCEAYNLAQTPRQRVNIAVERIEHFIKTGE